MKSASDAQLAYLSSLADALKKITDPRDTRSVRHDFHGIIAITFLGMLSRLLYIAPIQRWVKRHWETLRKPLGFKRTQPHATFNSFLCVLRAFVRNKKCPFVCYSLYEKPVTPCPA